MIHAIALLALLPSIVTPWQARLDGESGLDRPATHGAESRMADRNPCGQQSITQQSISQKPVTHELVERDAAGNGEPVWVHGWVQGAVELSEAEADHSARSLVIERLQTEWAARGQQRAQEVLPSWTPGFVADRAIQRFLTDRQFDPAAVDGLVRIAERRLETRSHDFGESFEVALCVEPDAECLQVTTRLLDRRLRGAQQAFWALCGGTVLLWAFLALSTAWLDRLTRSFMTGRLVGAAGAVGLALPTFAFLL